MKVVGVLGRMAQTLGKLLVEEFTQGALFALEDADEGEGHGRWAGFCLRNFHNSEDLPWESQIGGAATADGQVSV